MHFPVAGGAANLAGENRNVMPRRAEALRSNDQIALGAAAGTIETAREDSYSHWKAPRAAAVESVRRGFPE
jgi:uncharacterized protein YfiM (DUF2279 family)